jgi:putative flippase GtrA
MFDRDTARKAFRFCVTGGFVCGVDFGMLWVWNRFVPALVAVSAAYFIAVIVHFCLNKWWVFGNRSGAYRTQLVKYALTVGACWLCTVAFVAFALQFLTASLFVAKLFALPPTTALGFPLMKFLVFRPEPGK